MKLVLNNGEKVQITSRNCTYGVVCEDHYIRENLDINPVIILLVEKEGAFLIGDGDNSRINKVIPLRSVSYIEYDEINWI